MRNLNLVVWALVTGTCVNSANAHEVNVDSPLTPREEIAGVNTPPYPLSAFYEGEVGAIFEKSECYVPKQRLQSYSIGEWMGHASNEERARLVCAIILLAQGPEYVARTEAQPPHAEYLKSSTLKAFVLAEAYRAPYNLSAVEALSTALVVMNGVNPTDRRALLRAIAE